MNSYSYQYETSPRKIKPEYSNTKKTPKKTNKVASKVTTSNPKTKKQQPTRNQPVKKQQKTEPPKKNSANKVENTKDVSTNASVNVRTKFAIFAKCFLIFLVFFFIIYRNSLITQSFAKIQSLKTSITELQKENNQLEINIQNSLNTNNIEKVAKELLGMQKLTNKQMVYISLSKKDYVEPRTEEIIIEEDSSFIEKIIEKIKNIF